MDKKMTFYRFQDGNSTWDYYNYPVLERRFKLVKETAKGYWIQDLDEWEKPKWVSRTGRKRFAYPTREMALESYIKRKEKHIKILEAGLVGAKARLKNAKAIDLNGENGKILIKEISLTGSSDGLDF